MNFHSESEVVKWQMIYSDSIGQWIYPVLNYIADNGRVSPLPLPVSSE